MASGIDLAAYEELPKLVRDVLKYTAFLFDARDIYRAWASGRFTPEQLAHLIKEQDQLALLAYIKHQLGRDSK